MALAAAREIIREKGVTALSTRTLAARIGYTSGTLYQVFRNRDALVEEINIGTLDLLYAHCKSSPDDPSVQGRLRRLAHGFLEFANDHPREWDAVISYAFGADHTASPAYHQQVAQLLDLLCDAISRFYGPDEANQRLRDARLLWNSLYGIFALAAAGRLSADRSHDDAVDDLIDLYLAARA